jgi:hypothetical protein
MTVSTCINQTLVIAVRTRKLPAGSQKRRRGQPLTEYIHAEKHSSN